AQVDTSPPVDVNAMLKSLQAIKKQQTDSVSTRRNKIMQDFFSMSSNPANAADFYLNAVKATQFAGESRAQTAFQDWKKKEAGHLKSREFQSALRLHLNYLGLTLQRSGGAEIKDMLPAVLNYAHQAQAELETGAWNEDLVK